MKIKANGIQINYDIARRGAVGGDEPFAGLRQRHVGRAGAGAQEQIQSAALRHARPRRQRCAGGRLHARHAGRRPARSARQARRDQSALRRAVDGRHDRHDLRAQVSARVQEPGAVRHVEPHSARGAAGVGRAHQDRYRAGHGAAGGAHAQALVHRAVSRQAQQRSGARGRHDSQHTRRRLRRLLPRDPEDQRHRPARRDQVSGAGHRRRQGRRHAGGDVGSDPPGDPELRAGRDPGCFASVQPGAAGGVQCGVAEVSGARAAKANSTKSNAETQRSAENAEKNKKRFDRSCIETADLVFSAILCASLRSLRPLFALWLWL